MKRIITLVAALAVAATTFAVVAYGSSSRASATTVKVTAKDTFRFGLSRKSAPHGKVTFKVTNKGHVSHDFKIAGKKTPLIKPGKSATLTVTLKKGSYKYVCTVPGHSAAGMKGTFKAT